VTDGLDRHPEEPDQPDVDLWRVRRTYARAALHESDLATTWLEQFQSWLGDATRAGLTDPAAMVLATAAPDCRPSARTVLLRGVTEVGFVFFTNYDSRKGAELRENPRAALVFPWVDIGRQVVVDGNVSFLTSSESDVYFDARPHGSKLAAIASQQSQVIGSRSMLDDAHAELRRQYPEDAPVPRPPVGAACGSLPSQSSSFRAG
jgi:pyridoxamine 5'-phosphate oxidase